MYDLELSLRHCRVVAGITVAYAVGESREESESDQVGGQKARRATTPNRRYLWGTQKLAEICLCPVRATTSRVSATRPEDTTVQEAAACRSGGGRVCGVVRMSGRLINMQPRGSHRPNGWSPPVVALRSFQVQVHVQVGQGDGAGLNLIIKRAHTVAVPSTWLLFLSWQQRTPPIIDNLAWSLSARACLWELRAAVLAAVS